MVDRQQIVWAQALPEGTSAQKAELIALTKALELGEGKKININTDTGLPSPQHMFMVPSTSSEDC